MLDVSGATVLADYFLIAGVSSTRQAKAIGEAIQRELKERGLLPIGVEGREEGWWVLIDYGSVVVHIQQEDARAYYELDMYWGDCPQVQLEPIAPTAAA